jgi:hypothetical protein
VTTTATMMTTMTATMTTTMTTTVEETTTADARHSTTRELEAGLRDILLAPKEAGVVELIVRRPRVEEREVLEEGELSLTEGLVGDNWKDRSSSRTRDGSPHPDMQLNVMSSRVLALVAGGRERWRLAGDQLIVDMDLCEENLPAGTRLALGSAVIEVTEQPHTGCKKFVARFGPDAMKFVNTQEGRRLRLRGLNAKVVRPGVVRIGDAVSKI